ncbi:MAG TPA: hypothetical protein VFD59_09785 [Nocardioidaceae bacterium]|nr:hypothetical protein [Nocardioidaceae bacterium]
MMGLAEHLMTPDADPAEASIRFGTDADAAHAAAERCTAAYTATSGV